jgi:hypothetical protein
MSISRYTLSGKIKGGKGLATSTNISKIFNACENNNISFEYYVLEEGQRLDQLAGLAYNSASYWWVIAAASGIGWGLQVPPGTVLRIPDSLAEVIGYL